ncbi:SDR family NAD(P)-dependent oxidoreductase [Mangrovimicrobium sediminis]|uniref:SDR family NAD(P)-dependent oxidoreductase n=1 Tax=Mangrovimicrobium sediminis TaxID=2562682 RepID=A0A4Z0M0W4_9GAMM|nr:SDR family NAD(P)-dependent oxidoreductase [Haliea sp. SAOS-164]TGD73323.1 SDR family NAD(P)-dependent oxidoreductase [Haliea sp. SAOS-164]
MDNNNIVAVVTGASRGAGRGIAIALGSYGCTVYVTGRSQKPEDAPKVGDTRLPGTIYETADAVTAAGGKGIAVRVDQADDDEIKALFEQVEREQGKLDILVNNAFPNLPAMTQPGNFWEKPLDLVDMLEVGVRGNYVASWYAAPLLMKNGGLIVFTSASGASHYVFGPVYGAHKASLDKFAADMAIDFRDQGVACLSIWMGSLLTERMQAMIDMEPDKYGYLKDVLETPEFTGHVIWALFRDPELMARSGQTIIGAEAALEYGVKDASERQPPSYRELYGVYPRPQFEKIIR